MRPLLVAAGLLLPPIGAVAQSGLFQRGVPDEAYYGYGESGMLRDSETALSVTNQNFGNSTNGHVTNHPFGLHIETDDITNQTFGTPLGGGILIMIAAGAGYATIKTRKRNKKNNQ